MESDENLEVPCAGDWFPNLLKNYKTYVMHAYTTEESTMDQSEYLNNYLGRDLQVHDLYYYITINKSADLDFMNRWLQNKMWLHSTISYLPYTNIYLMPLPII